MERSRGVAQFGFGGAAGGGGLLLLLLVLFLSTAAATLEADLEKRSGGSVSRDSTKDSCNYTILIETTCTKGAGTADQVSLRFGDSNSTDILVRHLKTKHTKWVDELGPMVLDDVPRVPFQECSIDVFKITGKCIHSQVCYFYLKHRGDDDWRPGQAQVVVTGAAKLSSNSFYFRRFLPRRVWHGIDNCEVEVTPFGIRHPRRVFGSKHESKLP
ncbi:embryo-specific protein ATS3A-like [Elaeis guineensis]|uniref:Embryo-specific protein ATS3A n=1 Tax=Elaeis guineensis var. tenera TaxID=51953 RepID=A0A6I9R5J3_ELAGV|nr:embryo-specific protein ATS3A [Elaeis guineensis]